MTRPPSRSTAALLTAGVVLSGLLSACGGGSSAPAATASALPLSTASTAAPSATTATPSASPSPSASSTATGDAGRVTTVDPLAEGDPDHLVGTSGSLSYDITVPTFTGSSADAAVVRAINQRVEGSARSAIDGSVSQNGDDDGHHTLQGTGSVSTNDGRTVQVVISLDDSYDGAAHPTGTVNTVVLVAATGAPVTLDQLFTDQRAALTAVGQSVSEVAASQGDDITEPDGLAPTAENWSAWQTSGDGVEFEFQDYQLGGHGVRSYVVPWDDVVPLLTPTAKALLAPTS